MSLAFSFRRLHRWSASVLGAFVLVHLVNHLVGIQGVEAHMAFMRVARLVYRLPLMEGALLAAAAAQVLSGAAMLRSGTLWPPRRSMRSLQQWSGLYLGAFLVAHVGAVLLGRGLLDLDTTFHFAAAGFHVWPFGWFFAPYYGLAVLAIGAHVGCALHARLRRGGQSERWLQTAVLVPIVAGGVAGLLIVGMLAGWLYPVEVPARYLAPFGG
jgi:succinate dehydrogenase/fumarate reductase cytochrome b subunit